MGRTERLVSHPRRNVGQRSTLISCAEYSLICQLLEWEKVLRQIASSKPTSPQAGEQPDTTFAKREAEELDEQMKARSSKRRKSEPDCGLIGSDQ